MSTASENQWSIDMRRASTFNLLYEAAVVKEGGPSTRPRGNKADRAKAVAERAREELKRMQELPPSSYKWTWGEQLTALARSGTRPGKAHSGYDISLRGGKISGENSLLPSLPTSHRHYVEVPDDVISLPPQTSLAGTQYFTSFRHRLYDPLTLKVSDVNSEDLTPFSYRHHVLPPAIANEQAPAPASSAPSPMPPFLTSAPAAVPASAPALAPSPPPPAPSLESPPALSPNHHHQL